MDKFEKLMEDMKSWSQADVAKWIESNSPACICPDCPTYTDCAGQRNEALFCVVGKSPSCISTPETCICRDCPITDSLDLLNKYFYIEGSEKDRRGK